jgi:hypothetical protein
MQDSLHKIALHQYFNGLKAGLVVGNGIHLGVDKRFNRGGWRPRICRVDERFSRGWRRNKMPPLLVYELINPPKLKPADELVCFFVVTMYNVL